MVPCVRYGTVRQSNSSFRHHYSKETCTYGAVRTVRIILTDVTDANEFTIKRKLEQDIQKISNIVFKITSLDGKFVKKM